MTLNKLTKKQALAVAQTAKQITVTDHDFGWSYKVVSFDEMVAIIAEYAGNKWNATQYQGSTIDNIVSIDTLGRTHFEVTVA